MKLRTSSLLLASAIYAIDGYIPSLPSIQPAYLQKLRRTVNPFKTEGLDIDLPDFQDMFDQIQSVSPLARSVMMGENAQNGNRGLAAIDESGKSAGPCHASGLAELETNISTAEESLKWKRVESNKKATVKQIDRVDGYQGRHVPLVRFRSTLEGPAVGEFFGKFIVDLDERRKWDDQIKDVYEIYPIRDLDAANIAMGFGQYGDCSRMGVGYAQTKKAFGISPREQLFLYGLQDFPDGSSILWGTELDESYNHLMPEGSRLERAKSHLFAATLTPTSNHTFDVEYVLQLDIGGSIPTWLTTPIMIDTVKSLFKVAKKEFAETDGPLAEFLEEKEKADQLENRESLLMTMA